MKILLLSDVAMNENAGGLSQTLYNIFCCMQPADMLCVTSSKVYKENPPSLLFASRYQTYRFNIISTPKNRFAKYIHNGIAWVNYSFNKHLRRFKSLKTSIQQFNADVVIVCPNGEEGLFMYDTLKSSFRGKKVVPYFMDDWLYQSKLKWTGGDIQAVAGRLLRENASWLMISEYLGKILADRYSAKPVKVLPIHNPVNVHDIIRQVPVVQKKDYTIAYAGALWPMHFDAFLIMAKAIKALNGKMNIRLIVYTSGSNWNWRQHELEPLNVTYGGHIPYKEIHKKLAEADCLLITASFSKEWETHSKGSIQTKLTDYLKAGRLIISCGPSYAANNQFLKQHHCGVCIETGNEESAAQQLYNILKDIEHTQPYVHQGYEVLEKYFSFEIVHKAFTQFLANAS